MRTRKVYPRGNELLVAVINQIISDPPSWNQFSWHCGSSHCFVGWTQVLGGKKPTDSDSIESDFLELTDLEQSDFKYVQSTDRSFDDLYRFVWKLLQPTVQSSYPGDYPPLKPQPERADANSSRT
jgi:hypothetical protein